MADSCQTSSVNASSDEEVPARRRQSTASIQVSRHSPCGCAKCEHQDDQDCPTPARACRHEHHLRRHREPTSSIRRSPSRPSQGTAATSSGTMAVLVYATTTPRGESERTFCAGPIRADGAPRAVSARALISRPRTAAQGPSIRDGGDAENQPAGPASPNASPRSPDPPR